MLCDKYNVHNLKKKVVWSKYTGKISPYTSALGKRNLIDLSCFRILPVQKDVKRCSSKQQTLVQLSTLIDHETFLEDFCCTLFSLKLELYQFQPSQYSLPRQNLEV